MKNILLKLKFQKVVGLSLVLSFALAGSTLALFPSVIDHAKAEDCTPVYSQAIFDPYTPYDWGTTAGSDCHDFAPLAGGVHGSGVWSDNVTANVGDTITLRVYVHNAAATNSGVVMHNTRYNVNLDTGTGSNHTVTAQLTASNAAELDGSININIPSGAHLQLVSGNLSDFVTTPGDATGDLEACFGNAQLFYITIQVVGPAPTGNNSINATHDTFCQANGTVNGNVTWADSSDVQNVEVTVQSNGSTNSLTGNGGTPNGNSSTNWLVPGNTYVFTLYNTTNGQHTQIAQTTESVNDVNCGGNPPPQNGTGTLSLSADNFCQANGIVNGSVNWSTNSGVQSVEVTVQQGSTTNSLTGTGANPNGSSTTNWLVPGNTYIFTLYDTTNGQHKQLDQKSETVNANCAPTQNSTGSITLSADNFCQANGIVNGNINWSASSGVKSIELTVQTGSTTNSITGTGGTPNGNSTTNWLVPGNTYTFTLYDTTNGQHKQLAQKSETINVSCTQPVTGKNAISATANSQCLTNGTLGGIVTWTNTSDVKNIEVTVQSGNVTNSITGTGGTPNGSSTTNWLVPGSTYIFTLYNTTNGQHTQLAQTTEQAPNVNCNPAPNKVTLTCTANASQAMIGDNVVFTATGGTAPYTWATSNNSNAGSGSVFNVNFASAGTKTVSVSSSDGQTINCTVVINAPVQTTAGTCNNATNSCNVNTNTNNQTSTGNNSPNQNNQSNINGNNNTVTQTNNNCVNNSCNNNVVYITSGGTIVPANQFSQLSITKLVSANGSGYQNSVTVNNGQTVQFQITVTNTGNATANNVRITDNLPAGLSYNYNNSNNYNGNYNLQNGYYVGNLSAGQSTTVYFSATVNSYYQNNSYNQNSIQNTATASSDNAGTVQASAWVFVNSGCTYNCGSVAASSVNLSYSKSAVNNTKGSVDATSIAASRGDTITYTLTVTNSGNAPANSFVITDDLSQVLPYASVTDNGGGTVNGNTISFPGINVPANGSVTRSFQVQVNSALANNLSYVMTNTYGNTVTIHINTPQVLGAFTAPKTGADTNAFYFAGLLTASAAVLKKRKVLSKLIFT